MRRIKMVIVFCLFAVFAGVSAQVLSPARVNRWAPAGGLSWLELDYMEYASNASASNTYKSSDATNSYGASVFSNMTSNVLPVPQVASATNELAGYEAWHNFDSLTTDGALFAAGTLTGFWKIDLGSGNNKIVGRYGVVAGSVIGRCPKNFTLQGSTNNTNWDILNTQTNQTGWGVYEKRQYAILSPASYRYYKLDVTANDGNVTYTHMNELELTELASIGNLVAYSEPTIKSQGSYSLKAVAILTAASNDTLSRVISPPTNLTGKITVNYDLYSSVTGRQINVHLVNTNGITATNLPAILLANTWETKTWDISGVVDTNKSSITGLFFRVVSTNQTATNTFYIDNLIYQ